MTEAERIRYLTNKLQVAEQVIAQPSFLARPELIVVPKGVHLRFEGAGLWCWHHFGTIRDANVLEHRAHQARQFAKSLTRDLNDAKARLA